VVRHADLLERVRERVVPDVVSSAAGAHHRALVGRDAGRAPALGEHREGGAGEVVRA
jgi:hypothetical protein